MIQTLPLPQSILDWLESYLADRKQCTLVNGETSDYQSLNFSVPQGSILGPLLFIFYINSLPEVVLRAKIKIYADDIVLYVSSKDALTARTILQTELNRVVKHCDALGLTINIDKTKWAWYGSMYKLNRCPTGNLKIKGKAVKRTESYVYLGAKIDSPLSMKEHAKMIYNKVNVMAFKLSKLRKQMNESTALRIYKQVILPRFDFCSFLIDTSTKYWINRLETLQNRVLRVCLRLRIEDESTNDLRTLSEVPLLKTRRQELLTSFMFSRSKKLPRTNEDQGQNRRTRGDFKVKFPRIRPKNETYKKTPYYRGVTHWNALTLDHQQAVCKEKFKQVLKQKLGTNMKGKRHRLLTARRALGYRPPLPPPLPPPLSVP